jgi:hypothetical protein
LIERAEVEHELDVIVASDPPGTDEGFNVVHHHRT